MGVSRTGNGNYVAQTESAILTSGDVTLSQNSYTDILSLSLVPGVWLVYGFVNVVASATQDTTIRISDGSTHYASTAMSHDGGYDYSHSLFARIVLTTTTTIKLQGTHNGTGTITANRAVSTNSVGNNATQLLALKLDSSNPIGVVGGFAPLDSSLLVPASYLPSLAFSGVRDTGGDLTLTSTTFASLDASRFTLTITTLARRVRINLSAMVAGTALGVFTYVDVTIDGTRIGGTNGLSGTGTYSNGYNNVGFSFLTDVLSAGSHTFILKYRVSSNSGIFYASSSNPLIFQVEETTFSS